MRAFSKILVSSAASAAFCLPLAAHAEGDLEPTGEWSAYQRGNADLPPMGWNSWNAFTSDIDEEKLIGSADIIVKSGLAQKGYRYIDIDDGWWLHRRTSDGRMIIRTDNFPSAAMPDGSSSFRPLTDKLHAMGLKAGIYSDIGRNSCGQVFTSTFPNQPEGSVAEREVGLYGHIDQDIALYFKDWGFDLIKVDACGIRGLPASDPKVQSGQYRALKPLIDVDSLGRTDIPAVQDLYEQVRDSLEKYNPDDDFVFSLCLWGSADVRSWAKNVGNMSRTSEDISPTWSRLLFNLDSTSRRALYAHPGSWNDPDMLYLGAGEFDANHLTQARSHFALWAILNAPLMIGYDLRKADPEIMKILGNQDIIALNQDKAGNQAVLAFDSSDAQIFVKTLANGEKGVAILNRTRAPLEAVLTAEHLKFLSNAGIDLTDLWSGKTMRFVGEQKFTLAPQETLIFRARGKRILPDGIYLSEQPGIINPADDGVVVPEPEPVTYRALTPWNGTRGTGEHPRYGGWGGAQADSTPYGEQLAIGGKRYATGLGVLANSRLEVRNEGYRQFTAEVGVDDSARNRSAPVTFEIYGDGKLLAKSKPQSFGDAPQTLEADISGAKILELVARSPAETLQPDTVTWGNAALLK
ncbi:alpha-galactosidase [Altererythrobacter indicus]|uniref:Alpha-galactosidase n=1 Tax=Altericroceibacterium indicum TaxID=374177 RepID=A0A845A9Q8_9SPHN|nr:NPCBM/NEW2 domain-containing protein [Altericroceibacterium indicum]MXP26247.1 alpha-galactosidase [Altericroceibacterium indicum]